MLACHHSHDGLQSTLMGGHYSSLASRFSLLFNDHIMHVIPEDDETRSIGYISPLSL